MVQDQRRTTFHASFPVKSEVDSCHNKSRSPASARHMKHRHSRSRNFLVNLLDHGQRRGSRALLPWRLLARRAKPQLTQCTKKEPRSPRPILMVQMTSEAICGHGGHRAPTTSPQPPGSNRCKYGDPTCSAKWKAADPSSNPASSGPRTSQANTP